MAYAALSTVQTIATGQPFLAATLQQANDNGEFLVDPPACSIKETTPQSLTSGTPARLTSNEETFDNDAMHSTVSNTTRITIQTAGRYLIWATVLFGSNPTNARIMRFVVNNATSYDVAAVAASPSTSTVTTAAKALILSAADYVELEVLQDSGSAVDATMHEFAALFLTR